MTPSKTEELKVAANDCFVLGDWAEAENIYRQAMVRIDALDDDDKNREENILLMMDYARLLYLKERNLESRALSDRVLSMLDSSFPNSTLLKVESYLRMAETLSFFEELDETLNYLNEAEKLCESLEGEKRAILVTILSTHAAYVLSNEESDKFSEAESLIERAEKIVAELGIESGEDLANYFSTRAICIQLKGEIDAAQKYYLLALEALKETPLSPCFGEACFGYATLRATDSKFSESLSFLEEKIKEKEVELGQDHPILKRAISALALTYSACGELNEAELQAQRYNRIVEMMGNPGGELKIDCLRILIDILQQQSRFSEAQVLLARANDLAESMGNQVIQVRLTMDLARLKLDLGEFRDSVELYEKSLALTKKLKGPDHFETAICLGLLGNAYFAVQDFEKAEDYIRQSIKLSSQQEEFFGNLLGSDNYRYLGLVCLQQNKLEEAEDAFLKALSMLETTDMDNTLQVAETLKYMGELYEIKEEYELARQNYEKALALVKEILGENNFEVADYISCLADISRKKSQYKEAELLYEKALAIFEDTLGPSHPRTCILLQRFGEVSIEQNKYDQAETYFARALSRMEQTLGSNHPDVGYTSYCLGATYHWKELPARAEKFYRKALKIKEEQLGRKHADLATIIEPLIDVLNRQGKQSEANVLNRRMIEITGYDPASSGKEND